MQFAININEVQLHIAQTQGIVTLDCGHSITAKKCRFGWKYNVSLPNQKGVNFTTAQGTLAALKKGLSDMHSCLVAKKWQWDNSQQS